MPIYPSTKWISTNPKALNHRMPKEGEVVLTWEDVGGDDGTICAATYTGRYFDTVVVGYMIFPQWWRPMVKGPPMDEHAALITGEKWEK